MSKNLDKLKRLIEQAESGNDRRLIYAGLAKEIIQATEITENTEGLVIRFAYMPDEQERRQIQRNEQSEEAILAELSTQTLSSVTSVPSVAKERITE